MKKIICTPLLLTVTILFLFSGNSITYAEDAPQFVGVKTCSMCHKKAEDGEQLKIWEGSKHANAYKTLQTEKADKIAADKGLKTKAADSPECLKCHATGFNVDAALIGSKFKVDEGVQCETCHGAGGNYKKKSIMQDHAQAVAAGMKDYKDEAAIETQCKTCHNSESPTYKEFDFAKKWKEIAHNIPKK